MNGTHQTPDSKPALHRKPYTPPRLVSYGHVKDIVQGGGTGMTDAGGTRNCWVAEALYGESDPRTTVLRAWLTEIYDRKRNGWMFVELYRRVGPTVAKLIRDRWLSRRFLLPLFDGLFVKAFEASARTMKASAYASR